jgi:hypothetical protein
MPRNPRSPSEPKPTPLPRVSHRTFPPICELLWEHANNEFSDPITVEFPNWFEANKMRNDWNRYRTYKEQISGGNPRARTFSWSLREPNGNTLTPRKGHTQVPCTVVGVFGRTKNTDFQDKLFEQISANLPALEAKREAAQKVYEAGVNSGIESQIRRPSGQDSKTDLAAAQAEQINALNALRQAQSQAPQEADLDEDETENESFLDEFGW